MSEQPKHPSASKWMPTCKREKEPAAPGEASASFQVLEMSSAPSSDSRHSEQRSGTPECLQNSRRQSCPLPSDAGLIWTLCRLCWSHRPAPGLCCDLCGVPCLPSADLVARGNSKGVIPGLWFLKQACWTDLCALRHSLYMTPCGGDSDLPCVCTFLKITLGLGSLELPGELCWVYFLFGFAVSVLIALSWPWCSKHRPGHGGLRSSFLDSQHFLVH